jgi:nicotinamide phosphoribosyltransferase
MKEQILAREGTLVIRPDSGDPVQTLLRVFEILMKKFGCTTNEKGFKVLPPQVRVIQGDGISYSSIPGIFKALKQAGISAENLVLGMGGALLQRVNRDTQEFALKCSHAEINGQSIDVQKTPVELDATGHLRTSFKKSKAGKLRLIKDGNSFRTVTEAEAPATGDLLQTVFENGALTRSYTFEEVRKLAGTGLH